MPVLQNYATNISLSRFLRLSFLSAQNKSSVCVVYKSPRNLLLTCKWVLLALHPDHASLLSFPKSADAALLGCKESCSMRRVLLDEWDREIDVVNHTPRIFTKSESNPKSKLGWCKLQLVSLSLAPFLIETRDPSAPLFLCCSIPW